MQHINGFTGGMKRGIDYSKYPQDSYLLLRNGTMLKNNNYGMVITNINGNKNTNYMLGATEYPIASTSFNDIMYFMTYNTTTQKIRLYYKLNDVIEPLQNMIDIDQSVDFEVDSSVFGFTSGKLVEMIAKESYDGSTDLYLCDGLNPNIIINTGIDRNGIYTNRKYPVTPNKELFTHQKSVKSIPTVTKNVEVNGNLKPGAYYFYIRYEDESLNPSPFIKEVGPVFIHSMNSGILNDGQMINKRIVLNIDNADTNYKYISIGVVYLFGKNGLMSRENFIIDKPYTITGETINVVFDGNNVTRTLVLEELLKDNIKQNISETATQIDGVYYGANWKGTKENNDYLKTIASLIIPHAVLKDTSNFNAVYDGNNTENEYIEEEGYPLGVSFMIDGRYKTDVFPVLGWNEGARSYVFPNPYITYSKLKTDLSGANTDQVLEYFDNTLRYKNNNGIFYFPKKSNLSTDTDVHFRLMGLKMDYEYAKQYISAYTGEKPNITGIYIMQGKRLKNFVTQGYSVASVEAVGFLNIFDTTNYLQTEDKSTLGIGQNTRLGNNLYKAAFPLLDGSNVRLFPVLRVLRSYKKSQIMSSDDTFADGVWRLEANSPSELPVMDNEEEFLYPIPYKKSDDSNKRYFFYKSSAKDVLYNKYINNHEFEFRNIKTNKFCVYTPDILLDRSMVINSELFIKPVISLHDFTVRTDIPTDWSDAINHLNSFTQYNNVRYNSIPTYGNYIDNMSRVLNPLVENYKKTTYLEIRHTLASIINENTIYSDFNGFSSRMKSIIEVYGDDYKSGTDDQSNTITNFLNESRENLLKAGVLLNRTKKNTSDSDITVPIYRDNGNDSPSGEQWSLYPFSNKFAVPFDVERDENSIPQIVTNMSMKSTPYIGVVTDNRGAYLKNAYVGGSLDHRGLHNHIVNMYLYLTFSDYVMANENSYNRNSEMYSFILHDTLTANDSESIFKGDLFSQKTFMRCLRWTDLPEKMNFKTDSSLNYDKSYSWKYGRAFNLYLQSTTNTYLRVPGPDDTFYPYVKNENLGTDQETMDIFTWKGEKENMLRESWTYNDAYHQLLGLFKLPAFDEVLARQMFNNTNRIRFSLKHISGSIVDSYRELLLDAYHDYAFENGEILKLVKYNNTLFSIQSTGILQHYQSQKLEATGDTSEILLGDKSLLSDNYRQIGEYGTQHKESVCVGDNGIYGIDWNRECIWRIKPNATQNGGLYFGLEELNVQKSLFTIFKEIKRSNVIDLKQDLYGTPKQGITSVYDEKNHEILFTIHYGYINNGIEINNNTTIVFSEIFDTFVAEYSFNNSMFFKHGNKLFSFIKGNRYIQEQYKGTSKLPIEIEFIINCATQEKESNASSFEKEFKAHLINMCPEELDYIKWETEYQFSEKNPFINNINFWSNPEYREHIWRVPIEPNQNVNNGPTSTDDFKSFEQDSQMKGQWIKVSMKYSGDNEFVLRDVVTNFIISF